MTGPQIRVTNKFVRTRALMEGELRARQKGEDGYRKLRRSLATVGGTLLVLGIAGVAAAQTQTYYACLSPNGMLSQVSRGTRPTCAPSSAKSIFDTHSAGP